MPSPWKVFPPTGHHFSYLLINNSSLNDQNICQFKDGNVISSASPHTASLVKRHRKGFCERCFCSSLSQYGGMYSACKSLSREVDGSTFSLCGPVQCLLPPQPGTVTMYCILSQVQSYIVLTWNKLSTKTPAESTQLPLVEKMEQIW